MVKGNCCKCNVVIIKRQYNQKYCNDCNPHQAHKGFTKKPCNACGTEFTPRAPRNCYCSEECKDENAYLLRTYGITSVDYARMLEEQNGVCYICYRKNIILKKGMHKGNLCVDHCHDTGRVRGLLCHNCNRALGLLQDSTERLERAIAYLTHKV